MRTALDSFEVEGIGHNLPFLSAVMDHPRFVAGDITTAFIAEEYPDGFQGVTLAEPMLRRVAAAAAAMHRVAEIRRTRISGRMGNHERRVGADWVVTLQGDRLPGDDRRGSQRGHRALRGWAADARRLRLDAGTAAGAARRGRRLLVMKVARITAGYRVRVRGADLKLACCRRAWPNWPRRMPEKAPPDTSKLLLCPMPGLVVRIDVAEGDEVFDGQALAMVEAMKMENVLRAERKALVVKVHARPGDSLAVDDVIMEFE